MLPTCIKRITTWIVSGTSLMRVKCRSFFINETSIIRSSLGTICIFLVKIISTRLCDEGIGQSCTRRVRKETLFHFVLATSYQRICRFIPEFTIEFLAFNRRI